MNIDKAKKWLEIYFCPMVKRKKKNSKIVYKDTENYSDIS